MSHIKGCIGSISLYKQLWVVLIRLLEYSAYIISTFSKSCFFVEIEIEIKFFKKMIGMNMMHAGQVNGIRAPS